ncbi:MAG TPA: bifunctional diguanylate cyclase/phosphodiesterase [Candidatus Dormibacteraeota bacterium]|jgi:diguanylate cyclase (GGDEF)-like protein|nr:bifunctional diguanylate cyclase/phosphodiesterase [Candidatus Dormibacteraeota bacterium]
MRRHLLSEAVPSERVTMATSGAFLYGAGATLVLLTALTNRAPETHLDVILAVVTVAFAVTAALLVGRHRIPQGFYPYITMLGSVLITMLVYFDGADASSYILLYLWAALYAFYFYRPIVAVLETAWIGLLAAGVLYLRDANNVPFSRWVMVVGSSLVAGAIVRSLVVAVWALADRDGLTGLANRRRLDIELDREMARASRTETPLSVIILDLDNFKAFNDEMGHPEGDRHLQRSVAAWRNELRQGDLLARQGGEEFSLVLPDCGPDDARLIADRLRSAVPHGQTVSAGVAYWNGSETGSSLLGRADAALYEAKIAGRDRTVLAAPTGTRAELTDLPQSWAQMLPTVLEKRDIRFGYQPIVHLQDREVFAYEALARPHGLGVNLSVEGFFAAATRLGLGRDLDWMCRRICLESSREVITDKPLFMNIGVSSLLAPVHDVDQMLMLLEHSGWSPQEVVLEITERDQISDLDRFQQVLTAYRDEGFRFAIDDVGDGHSTLEVLAAGAPEFVKIAKRLTAGVGGPGARAAVEAVVAYANALGSQVIAEGIEDEYQLRLMSELGCHMGQGYALGRPQWLREPGQGQAAADDAERPPLTVVRA